MKFNITKTFSVILISLMILELIACSNDKGEQYFNKALTQLQNKNYNEALDSFELAILKKNNELTSLKNKTGKGFDKEKIKIKENELAESFFYRGYIYKIIGNHEEAVKEFSVSIKLNSIYSKAYAERGISFYQLEFFHKSVEDITKAIKLEPNNQKYYYNRACVYIDLINYEKAIKDLSFSIELDNSFSFAYLKRAETYKLKSSHKEAIEDYKKAISLLTNKNHIYEAYLSLGMSYYNLKKYKEAEQSYINAMQYNENPIIAYLNLSILYDTSDDTYYGNPDKSIEFALKSVELSNYKNVKSLVFLASLYYKNNQADKAYELQKIASEIKPNDKEIIEWLDIYKKSLDYNFP